MLATVKQTIMQRIAKRRFLLILWAGWVGLCCISRPIFAESKVERLFWDKVPLNITLTVGQERLITFPAGVRVGIPGALNEKLRTQSNAGTVYWLAKKPFEAQRIEVHEIEGGGIYLIDLRAVKAQRLPNLPIEIQRKQAQSPTPADLVNKQSRQKQFKTGLVTLSRFAAQQLYAPTRLLNHAPAIQRVSVSRRPLPHLIRGEDIQATPLASWHSGSLTVTAVELKNNSRQFITLDPRQIRGQWRAATFQYTRLHPVGSEADSTAVYLISDRPFHEVFYNGIE